MSPAGPSSERRAVYIQARTALAIMATMFLVLLISEKLGFGDQKPQYLFTIGLTPMVSGAYLGVALMYVTLPFRDLEFFVAFVLSVLLEFYIFAQRPFTWDMATRLGAIGVGIGIVCWGAMIYRIATTTGAAREQAYGYLCVASIMPLFPKVSSWMHYFIIHGTKVIYDQYGYAIDGLTGCQPPILMARFFIQYPWVHDLSMFVYNKLPLLMVVATLFWLNRPARAYFNPVMTMVVVAPICMGAYAMLPMIGITLMFPHYPPDIVPTITQPVIIPLEQMAPVSCMPSMHAVWIFTIFLTVAPQGRAYFLGSGLLVILTLLATLGPEAGHYLIDLFVAVPFLLFFVALFLNDVPGNRQWRLYSMLCGSGFFLLTIYLIRFQIDFLLAHRLFTLSYFALLAGVSSFLHWKIAVLTLAGMKKTAETLAPEHAQEAGQG